LYTECLLREEEDIRGLFGQNPIELSQSLEEHCKFSFAIKNAYYKGAFPFGVFHSLT